MFGEEAVCPDGLFVPAVFQESDFYLNSLTGSYDNIGIVLHTGFYVQELQYRGKL
jgi:hypothetical protein